MSAPSDWRLLIVDDDRASLGFDPAAATVAEGSKASFTVRLSKAASSDVTFRWQTADDTATAGSDYTAQAATDVTIAAGDTSATLEVQTTADTTAESDETFAVNLSRVTLPTGVSMGAAKAEATIENDDTVAVSMEDVTVSESDGTATITVTLAEAAELPVILLYGTSDGTATAGADYTGATGNVLIAAGDTTRDISVNVLDDEIDEADETFEFTLTKPESLTWISSPDAPATVTITDDEETPTVSLALGSSSVGENGGSTTVTATLSAASSEAVEVTVSAAAVAPAVAGDFSQTGTTLTIAAGSTTSTGTVTIAAVDNEVDAPRQAGHRVRHGVRRQRRRGARQSDPDDHRRRVDADGVAGAEPVVHRRGRRLHHGHGDAERRLERGGRGDGVRRGGVTRGVRGTSR